MRFRNWEPSLYSSRLNFENESILLKKIEKIESTQSFSLKIKQFA
jgi:hypothetical protein